MLLNAGELFTAREELRWSSLQGGGGANRVNQKELPGTVLYPVLYGYST